MKHLLIIISFILIVISTLFSLEWIENRYYEPEEIVEKRHKGELYSISVSPYWYWYKMKDENLVRMDKFENGTRKIYWKKYVGEIENGLPNGKGTITSFYSSSFDNESGDSLIYIGEMMDGEKHGQGTYTETD